MPLADHNGDMTAGDFDQILSTLSGRSPFRPFTVEEVGGCRFKVDYAHALVYRDGAAVFVASGGVPMLFDPESVTAIIGDTGEASA